MKLREGIVAVIQNSKGQVLIFERADHSGSYQFPQGGIEEGENPVQALFRELKEEIGTDSCRVIKRSDEPTIYILPKPIKGYDGAKQTWFLVEFTDSAKPQLDLGDHSFKSYKWEEPKNVLSQLVDWKRDSFAKGLKALGFSII